MRFGVRGIHKLTRDKAIRDFLRQLFGARDGTLHALGALGQNKFRTVSFHKLTTLNTHGFRHNDDNAIPARGGHGSKSDARVSRGRLDDGGIGVKLASGFGLVQHRLGNAVLHATSGVEIFQLRQNLRRQLFGGFNMGELQQRGSADQLIGRGVNLCHDILLLGSAYFS